MFHVSLMRQYLRHFNYFKGKKAISKVYFISHLLTKVYFLPFADAVLKPGKAISFECVRCKESFNHVFPSKTCDVT